ncbi:hypothetical protein [Paenibacillus sp. MMO-177]|uniref:hypothetical protein n=1 Tax=Paenibacillus sp. MMO-177 TaxID=3081289 RepID=UPI003018C7B0
MIVKRMTVEEAKHTEASSTCNYCSRGKLRPSGTGLEYPYKEIVIVKGTYVVSCFCPDCFEEIQNWGVSKCID